MKLLLGTYNCIECLIVQYINNIFFSYDGIAFAMHDLTLERTTNVKDVFPDQVQEPAANFNMSDLRKLNAGSWFIKVCNLCLVVDICFKNYLRKSDLIYSLMGPSSKIV